MAASNLFAFDFDAALRIVGDANAALAARVRRVLDARGRMPAVLLGDDDVGRARRYAELLGQVREECRQARLADTRPLRAFVSRVEGFFKAMEADLAEARAEAVARLTAAARRQARRGAPAVIGPVPASASPPAPVIHDALSGEVVATARPALSRDVAPATAIPTTWVVASLDRDALDLEALRPFLTEAALLHAARAHLKAHGPGRLPGAHFARRALA